MDLGNLHGAVEMLELCLERIPESQRDLQTAVTTRSNLGWALLALAEFERAEALLRDSWESSARVLGKRHPDTIASLMNLAVCCMRSGRFQEAESHMYEILGVAAPAPHEDAEELVRELSDDQLATNLLAVHNLAAALRGQGRETEAEALYRRVRQPQLPTVDGTRAPKLARASPSVFFGNRKAGFTPGLKAPVNVRHGGDAHALQNIRR